MTDIIMHHPPPQISSGSSSTTHLTPTDNDGSGQNSCSCDDIIISSTPTSPVAAYSRNTSAQEEEGRAKEGEGDQLSLLAVLVTVFRKSLVACKSSDTGGVEERQLSSSSSSSSTTSASRMEISWPNNVRHVAHVTFDRFNGFLGLPVEFEPEVPRRPPSASVRVFGVSTESMQLSYDSRGNCVPTILLMMQRRLYSHGGLQAEGIFRINAENGQEEYVREQLNSGVVPDDIDVHCLAGLIKAWFRELPKGILDSLSPEEVMQAQTEEECVRLVRQLPQTESALLDWAINLMADVAQLEHHNKMNARNIAMVFAPNMTQMADPLTALMYAVQVMNFLKTLITRTLREREDSIVEDGHSRNMEPFDENGHHGGLPSIIEETSEVDGEEQDSSTCKTSSLSNCADRSPAFLGSIENMIPDGKEQKVEKCWSETCGADKAKDGSQRSDVITGRGRGRSRNQRSVAGQSSVCEVKKGGKKMNQRAVTRVGRIGEKGRDMSIISRLNTQTERVEAWR